MSGSSSLPKAGLAAEIIILDFAGCNPPRGGNPPYHVECEEVIVTPEGERFPVVRFGLGPDSGDLLWVSANQDPYLSDPSHRSQSRPHTSQPPFAPILRERRARDVRCRSLFPSVLPQKDGGRAGVRGRSRASGDVGTDRGDPSTVPSANHAGSSYGGWWYSHHWEIVGARASRASALAWLIGSVRPRFVVALERVTAVNRVLEAGDLVVPARFHVPAGLGPGCFAEVPVRTDLHRRILDAIDSGLPCRVFRRGTYRSACLDDRWPAVVSPGNCESGVDMLGSDAGLVAYALGAEVPFAVLCLVDRLIEQPGPAQAPGVESLEIAVGRIVAREG